MAGGRTVLAILDQAEDRGIDTCATCPTLCRWSCPVAEAEARETTTPHRLVVLSGFLKNDRASVQSVGALPYHCSHCLACTKACLHENDVPLWLSLSRERVLSGGAAPPAVREVCGHFGVAGNPQGRSLEEPLCAAVEAAGQGLDRAGEVAYLPGCETIAKLPEAITGLLRGSSLLGISDLTVRPASAGCCGAPLLWAGELEGFRAHASRFVSQFSDAKRLVVHDSACAHTLRVRYGQVGVTLPFEVVHVSQFLAERLRLDTDVKSTSRLPGDATSIAYNDACTLARGLGVTEQPRRLLRRITDDVPRELDGLVGREVDCCGAGGLLPATAPETAAAMAEERIAAFERSGATRLAMFSPRCVAHLAAVRPGLPVVDIGMLLARL